MKYKFKIDASAFSDDHRGNLLLHQTSGSRLAYAYDLSNRVTQITYSSGRLVQYGYDENDCLLKTAVFTG